MRRALSPRAILDVWEQARNRDPVARALTLWAAGEPDRAVAELAGEPIGRRDAALLHARMATFGQDAACFLHCPACGQPLEFRVDVGRLVVEPPDAGPPPFKLEHGAWCVMFRLPDSDDLAAVSMAPDPAAALVERCVLSVTQAGEASTAAAAYAAVGSALETEMGRLDPQADVAVGIDCADCGHRWDAPFDIAGYLWRELEVEARRLLREVDALARSYGWSEAEILELGAPRRRTYLELLEAR